MAVDIGTKKAMKNSDKFLLGIVIASVILVGVTLLVVLNQPQAEYRVEDSPESVVHNYLLALKKMDYSRAAGYLADCLERNPADGEDLFRQISNERWYFEQLEQDSALSVENAVISGELASVRVVQRFFYNNGLFGSSEYSDEFTMRLMDTSQGWKLVMGERYWLPEQWKSASCP